jgi:8-amino-7-oxononanoate synthase
MSLLSDKLGKYDLPQQYIAKGVYPYFRVINSHQDTEVMIEGKKILMFGSNAYMGLTYDQRIINAAIEATKIYGTGCAGSRFLNGTLDIHVQLEKELAAFVGKEDALCFSTGFTVNEGVIPAMLGRSDYIICDDRDHASIVDGRRLSFATQLKYKHNDMESLEKELQKCEPNAIKLIVVDGVFSMEGDLANLPEIVKLKKKYNAVIYVDEAHGLGVFGRDGRGVCDHFGLTDEVDLIMGTFSKSLASLGGFIAADKKIINFLRHHSRSYIFQASMTPAATAATLEALHIIQNSPERIKNLWEITNYALKKFRDAGFEIGATESPIIPLYVRDEEKTFVVTKMAFDEGIFINPVIPPACAPQDTLVRFALMATHTKEQVDIAVEKLMKCFKTLGILNSLEFRLR